MDISTTLIIFTAALFGGLLLDVLITKLHYLLAKSHYKEHHFKFRKYIWFIIFPLITVLLFSYITDWTLFGIFIAFALIGTIGELFTGWAYHQVMGQRLWTYHRYSIGKYTSFLSIPLWGFAGIFVWLLAKLLLQL